MKKTLNFTDVPNEDLKALQTRTQIARDMKMEGIKSISHTPNTQGRNQQAGVRGSTIEPSEMSLPKRLDMERRDELRAMHSDRMRHMTGINGL